MKKIAALLIACFMFTPTAWADDLRLSWSDMAFSTDADGTYIETPPNVSLSTISQPLNTIRFAKFSKMRRVELHDRFNTVTGYDDIDETVYVFRVWQGGATQGEQLMLLTVSDYGVAVIGPHPQDFETLTLQKKNVSKGVIFAMFGGDPNVALARTEYLDGEFIDLSK